MDTKRWSWVIGLGFLLIAGATRFYRIGWSVEGDDTTMMDGVRSLREKPFFPLDGFSGGEGQARMIPLPHLLQGLAYDVFGYDEAGIRTGSAIAGALIIAISVMVVSRLHGPANGIILGIMLVMCSWLMFHHQSNRHYSYAFFFGALALLTTQAAWQRNTPVWGVLAGCCTALAVAMHSAAAILPLSILAFMFVEALMRKTALPKRALWAYWTSCIPLVICALAPIIWLKLTSSGFWVAIWGRSPSHSVAGLVFNLGFSVALLAVVGWFCAWRSGTASDRLCAVVAVVAVFTCALVPLLVSSKYDYVLPVALSFFLLASRTLTAVYGAIVHVKGKRLAVAVTGAILLMPLPSFASYYQDGDRKDYRAAAKFIEEHLEPGDTVAADIPGCLGYYLDVPVESGHRIVSDPDAAMAALTRLATGGQRVWYVCRYARDVLRPDADRWLWRHAVRMRRIRKKRFDYHENILDVYLINEDQTEPVP